MTFDPISSEEWKRHNEWELNWWGNCVNTYGEQHLQEMYIQWMKLSQFNSDRWSLDLKGMSVLDIGGGPVSILLRCKNFSKAAVIDPLEWPGWVVERYRMANILLIRDQAENMTFDKEWDEAWIYNCLQHVTDPDKVARNAIRAARTVRLFEPLNIGIHSGHPHNLTKELLDKAFGKEGIVIDFGGGAPGRVYYCGVFTYG